MTGGLKMNRGFSGGKTACFAGHQSERLPQGEALKQLRIKLSGEIEKAIKDGYNTFLFGGTRGWELMAAGKVVKRKTLIDFNNPCYIRLIAIIPYEEQAVRYSLADHELYYKIMSRCDEVITLNIRYNRQCYAQRDQYIVEHSNRVICYWDRQVFSKMVETFWAMGKEDIEIINLYE